MDNKIDTHKTDDIRKHKIGTLYINEISETYRYIKIDFGEVGKINGRMYRYSFYQWIRIR